MARKSRKAPQRRTTRLQPVSAGSRNGEVKRSRFLNVFFIFAFLALIIIVATSFYSYYIINQKVRHIEDSVSPVYNFTPFVSFQNSTVVSMILPAVDDKGAGVVTSLVVEAMPGSGRTLVDIDNLLFWADTQQSIRTARLVASNITGKDINDYDLIYNIHANATIIGGGSAGAALALATIAAIQNKSLKSDIMITGAINHDGTIGPVSEILAKAKVAKSMNASLLLVPLTQSKDVVYESSKHCERFGFNEVCTIEQIPTVLVVSEKADIQVMEVSSIEEALGYYTAR